MKEGSFGRRQNVMVSATLSKGVEKLAGLTLTDPEHIKLSEDDSVNQDQLVTPNNLFEAVVSHRSAKPPAGDASSFHSLDVHG